MGKGLKEKAKYGEGLKEKAKYGERFEGEG